MQTTLGGAEAAPWRALLKLHVKYVEGVDEPTSDQYTCKKHTSTDIPEYEEKLVPALDILAATELPNAPGIFCYHLEGQPMFNAVVSKVCPGLTILDCQDYPANNYVLLLLAVVPGNWKHVQKEDASY